MDQVGFYETLFTYFYDIGSEKFNPREIPKSEVKKDMIEASKKSWRLFFEDNIDKFVGDGYVSKDCYTAYNRYCEKYGYMVLSLTKFGLSIKKFVDITKRKRNGDVIRYYTLNSHGMKLHEEYKKELEELSDIQDQDISFDDPILNHLAKSVNS